MNLPTTSLHNSLTPFPLGTISLEQKLLREADEIRLKEQREMEEKLQQQQLEYEQKIREYNEKFKEVS